MNEKITQWTMVAGIGIVILLIGAAFLIAPRQITISNAGQNGITVSGSAQAGAMPDKAVMYLGITSQGSDPEQVQQENARIMEQIKSAVKAEGVKEKEIETTLYNLYPWREYDYSLRRTVDKGYQLQHTIAITTQDIENVGKILDAAVQGGANEVQNIAFMLSDEKEKEVREQLIAEATSNAKEKAEALASSVDVSLGKAISVSENSYYPGGWYYPNADLAMLTSEKAATEINPQQVTVQMNVNVVFEIR